jgi:hypothetical protein
MGTNGFRRCAAVYKAKTRKSTGEWLPETQCGGQAVKDGVYCRRHTQKKAKGSASPEHYAALVAGLKRYHEALRKSKAAGGIGYSDVVKARKKPTEKVKRIKKQPQVPGTPPIRHILKTVEIIDTVKAQLPAIPDRPFEQLEDHEKLTSLTGITLDMAAEIIAMPRDPEGRPVLFKAQMKLISDVWSFRTKTDKNSLVAKKQDRLVELVERLKNEKVING